MAIEQIVGGGVSITGKRDIGMFRLLTLKHGLGLELRTKGKLKMTRGPACFTIIKKEFGLKGDRQSVYDQFCKIVEEKGIERNAAAAMDRDEAHYQV
jgi:hypothetical protein